MTPTDLRVIPLSEIEARLNDFRLTEDVTELRRAVYVLIQVANAADDYRGWTGSHHWRCEFRTASKGWKKGDPPVIECVCGLDRLNMLLGELGLNA